MQLVADRSLVEIYIDAGQLVDTVSVFPTQPFTALEATTTELPGERT